MAVKYIIHGAAFNGDGTSSAAATSAGGVGAWNNINVFEGTSPGFGVLAAGDVVHIRALDASNTPITRTMTASITLGSAAGTTASPVVWRIDNGAIWSGVTGVITYTHASTWQVIFRANNQIFAADEGGLIVRNTSTNQSAGYMVSVLNGYASNVRFEWTTKTGTGACGLVDMASGSVLERPLAYYGVNGGAPTDSSRGIFRNTSTDGVAVIINPYIELQGAANGSSVFGNTNRSTTRVIGGDLVGAGATSGQPLYRPGNISGVFQSVGFQFPRTMDVTPPSTVGTAFATGQGGVYITGCDGGIGGYIEGDWGYATSRTDSNPPTLSAMLPNSENDKWTWRVYPKTASAGSPMRLQSSKLFVDASGTREITQELLVANTMTPTTDKVWITVEYTDATTGLCKHITTKVPVGSTLPSSSALWSAQTWGPITFNKYKLAVTTPTAIKQDTLIHVTVWGTLASASANDIYFVDPDFGVN